MKNASTRSPHGGEQQGRSAARQVMSPWLACIALAIALSAACGDGDENDGAHQGDNRAGSAAAAGSASGSFNDPVGGGNTNGAPETSAGVAAVGEIGGSSANPPAGSGGAHDRAGAGGAPVSTGISGEAGGGGVPEAGGGGMPGVDTRPGCELAALIGLSNLRQVEANDERVYLALDVTNGTPMFVSYTPIKFSCVGGAVLSTQATTNFFGISPGGTREAKLAVVFQPDALTGDVVSCTVRGAIANVSPDDCANAQTMSFELTVP